MLHQVGARNVEEIRARLGSPEEHPRYHVEAFIDTTLAFAAADLLISRSGGTVAEITAVGVPSVLFPYPYHKDQHQKLNAQHLVDHGAAVLCEDQTTTPEMLAGIISELRSDPAKLKKMAAASAALGKPDAAEHVARVALSVAEGN